MGPAPGNHFSRAGAGGLGSWRGLFISHRHFCHCCWGCWGAGGGPLFLRTRHFCHFWCCCGGCGGAAEELAGPLFLRTRHFCHFCWGGLMGGCWGLLGSCWGAGGALYFSEPVTFVTFGAAVGGCGGAAGELGGPFISQNPLLLSLLVLLWGLRGGCGGAGGGPLFLRTRHFCHFWGCCGGWLWGAGVGGPFISQNPSLLSLLLGLLGGCWGAAGWGGPLLGLLGGCWAAGALILRTRHFCHLGFLTIWVWLQIERFYMHRRGK